MTANQGKLLVVDDTPQNVKLLADLLEYQGYQVIRATTGTEALEAMEKEHPDLVLLDVMLPDIDGYRVCKRIRENPATRLTPVVMVTALDAKNERVAGIEAGADDFLSKPINTPELLARVRSLLRIKQLHDTIQEQAGQLADWNRKLEQRVQEQVQQIDRLGALKRFLPPQIADLVIAGADDPLRPHRREITVVFVDLRGFTAFAGVEAPEEVMRMLGEFHAAMGSLVWKNEGTLERFTGDGMMIFFNDPVQVPDPEQRAVRMALDMRAAVEGMKEGWDKRGYGLGMGIGISNGHATIGAIGFEKRWDYAAIGTVTNLSARLCGLAKDGQIIVSRRLFATVENLFEAEPVGELTLKGIQRPITALNVLGSKPG
jgi:class 3 adenylate cyclase/CheY-like chemotaxis protein